MTASFRIDSEGGQELERKLGRVVRAFEGLEPLMAGIGVYLEGSAQQRFQDQKGPDGRRWKPSQRALRDGGKTLIQSHLLEQSITSAATGRRVEVGTNRVYAGVHQFGFSGTVTVGAHTRTRRSSTLPGGLTYAVQSFERQMNMPARPFLGVSSEDETEIGLLIDEFLMDAFGATAPD
ncbi:phage virion morphogenesis protein [Novosphingobium sp. NDB2Meth1]|uniref:phage virion morphogenesis protein n=1 Tax=Novosphingobium sp. NDB2Meth1 TaxID=1892847 RepID=UPI0009307971|nr:phage virion morphogenesis protein [Novosphingobium sp. NDB2Meth1]